LVVDNTACSPVLQQPLGLGADVVVYSTTKFLDGQGRALGGAVLTNRSEIAEAVHAFLRTAGPAMSPFNAWIVHKGLETLAVRMKESCLNAGTIAHWLEEHTKVRRVYYPGLKNNPVYALATRQQNDFGAVLAFEVMGGKTAAWKLIDTVQLFSVTGNLGDVKSTITHPATTTHARLDPAMREQMGIGDGLIRISVGLEDVQDLIEDLASALQSL